MVKGGVVKDGDCGESGCLPLGLGEGVCLWVQVGGVWCVDPPDPW